MNTKISDIPQQGEIEKKEITISDLQRVKAPGYVGVYASNANVTGSFFDVTLIFGVVDTSLGPEVGFKVEDRAAVTMTWEHARALYYLLGSRLADYEANNGPIRKLREPDK